MHIVTAAEMRTIDQTAMNEYGIPGVILMENAGLRLVNAILMNDYGPDITIVAGRGNNGGDGFVAARHLYRKKKVTVWTTARDGEYSGDALLNLHIVRKLGVSVTCLREPQALQAFADRLQCTGLIVDALFGTGLSRELDPFYAGIIERMNQSNVPVVSVDIPSGVCADTGKIMGAAVKAARTVTFALPKAGHFLYPGAGLTGHLDVVDIGIPPALLSGYSLKLLTADTVSPFIPQRPADGHKGSFGSVLLVAGSSGMPGAAVLSSCAALRGGCGLLYAAVPGSIRPILANQIPEAITIALPESTEGHIAQSALAVLQEKWTDCSAVAIGPGLTSHSDLIPFLNGVCECPRPLVIDADGLNLLAAAKGLLKKRTAPTVLTPHPGEAARLLDKSTAEIQSARIDSARELAARYNCTVVLKGAHTLIAEPDKTVAVNSTGNSGMATAGSGDVLTGLLAALLAQGLTASHAAELAVYLHGLAGDLAAENTAQHSLTAGDLIRYISKAYLISGQNTYVERSLHIGY